METFHHVSSKKKRKTTGIDSIISLYLRIISHDNLIEPDVNSSLSFPFLSTPMVTILCKLHYDYPMLITTGGKMVLTQ